MYMANPPSFNDSTRAGQCEFIDVEEDEVDTSNLQAHIVGPEATQSLLLDRHPWTPPEPPLDPEALLSDLTQLAPSVAKSVTIKNRDADELVLRLIYNTDVVQDESSYIAMSYCWKKVNREMSRKIVSPTGDLPFGWVRTVEQFPLPTSKAMFEAVLRERSSEQEGLWFDQACINQEDEEEKATTIGAIDSIYRNARTVVVALDDIAADEHEESFFRQYIEQYSSSDQPSNQQPSLGLKPPMVLRHRPMRTFIERILSSIWFERAWCAHEMRMGRNYVFIVPCVSDEDDEVFTFIRFAGSFFLHLLSLAGEAPHAFPGSQGQISSLHQLLARKIMIEEQFAIQARNSGVQLSPNLELPNQYIPSIAEIFRQKAGGNPRLPEYLRRLDANRDRVSIALSYAGLPLALRPASPLQRPNIEDECLRQLLLICLAARDAVALCTTGTPLQLHDGSISWICRPTSLDVLPSTQPLPRFSSKTSAISQASDGRAEYVQLDLVFLDLPHRTQPNPYFPIYVQRARLFIDLCIQHRIQSLTTWTSWQAPGHPRAPPMKNMFVQTLACAFQCGPGWFFDVSNRLLQPEQQLGIQAIEILLHPQLDIQNFIITPDGQRALSLLLAFLCTLITNGIPWASGASERTCGPMVVSLSHTSHTSRAIIFAPFEHSKTLLVAVPDAVKAPEYASLARGWILTPFREFTGSPSGTTVKWTLVGKSVVFGDKGFDGSLGGGQGGEGRGHMVFGPTGLRSPMSV
ncbi:heterokaryon incompatibility protein-domain-containing protein [Lophiotrema nucula]|uniref:Heterokaryon incompatibility protein-domain-containing protein n=1 Tax=Lophiotrema nucula TaxID=690887 RepID=A0A6A5YTR9_9PLEO|nr:heterokaryon incompatibility protein-domain-containing protein [Lophiotrema nucula]